MTSENTHAKTLTITRNQTRNQQNTTNKGEHVMKLIIHKIGDLTNYKEIKITGIEIRAIDNEIAYVPKENENIIKTEKIKTNYNYQIIHSLTEET